MLNDGIKLTGKVSIKKYNEKKELVKTVNVPNLVVTVGKEFIASRMIESTADVMGYMAIGDDASTVAAGQSALINEITRESATTSRTGSNISFNASFGVGSAGDIKEAGIFNSGAGAGILFNADDAVDNSSHTITYNSHPFSDNDKITYTDGGDVSITGLIDGDTYYIVNALTNTFQLSLTLGGSPIAIEGGGGETTHRITRGTMLCRTTFPLISKSNAETLAITWVVTVG